MSADVSIIICTYNRADSLAQTLAAISRVDVPEGLKTELIVVDNGSTDHTARVVRSADLRNINVRRVVEPLKGLSRARNRGLREATGEVLLFTDDDVRPPMNWIDGMCRPILEGRADAVAGGVRIASHLLRPWMTVSDRYFFASTESINPCNPDHFAGANMAFSRRVRERVPFFDEELGAGAVGFGDDVLFGRSLSKAGYRFAGAMDIEVEHHADLSRLERRSFIQMVKKSGRTLGYISHHRDHARITVPRIRILKKAAELFVFRLLKRPWSRIEGIAGWEKDRVEWLSMLLQYVRERGRPHRYSVDGLLQQDIFASYQLGSSIHYETE